jgi:NUMOD4 motif.
MEIWKPIDGFENLYEVSNLGRVRSLFRYKKILKPNCLKSGYQAVSLYKNKRSIWD